MLLKRGLKSSRFLWRVNKSGDLKLIRDEQKGWRNQQKGLDADICLMHGEDGMDKGFIVKEQSSWKAFVL